MRCFFFQKSLPETSRMDRNIFYVQRDDDHWQLTVGLVAQEVLICSRMRIKVTLILIGYQIKANDATQTVVK